MTQTKHKMNTRLQFMIQDTKSSNGTFVNNRRLSTANEESDPVEVTSGDVVQFGVDVVENQKRVTHGCISATLRLFLPGGEEVPVPENANSSLISLDGLVPNSISQSETKSCAPAVISSSQLLQLTHCLREALNREEFLQKKIHLLEQVVDRTRESAESGWRSLMQEDALLSKIESLQMKLESVLRSLSAKSVDEETQNLRQEVQRLLAEKEECATIAKESILSHKKLVSDAEKEAQEVRIELSTLNQERECLLSRIEKMDSELSSLADAYDRCKEELQELMIKHKTSEEEIKSLTARCDRHPNEDAIDVFLREKKEREAESTRVKLADSVIEIAKLKDQIQILEQEKQSQEQSTAAQDDHSDEKDAEIDRLTATVNELMNNLNHANERYERKKEQYHQARSQHEPCCQLITELRDRVQLLEKNDQQHLNEEKQEGSRLETQSSFESPKSSSPLGSSSYSEITDQTDSQSKATTAENLAPADQEQVSRLNDRIHELLSSHEDQVKQLKSYIKCLESDLQEARVQMVIRSSMSPSLPAQAGTRDSHADVNEDGASLPTTSHEVSCLAFWW